MDFIAEWVDIAVVNAIRLTDLLTCYVVTWEIKRSGSTLVCACFYRGRLPSLVYPYSEIRVISNHPYSKRVIEMTDNKGIVSRITDAVSGAGGAIKATVDAVKDIQSLHVDYSVKEKTFDLLTRLMDIQGLLISAKERIIELEDEKKQKDNWEAEALNYELISPTPGSFIYRIKQVEDAEKPTIYICPSCHDLKKKSVLQFHKMVSTVSNNALMICNSCKSTYQIPASTLKEDFKPKK